MQIKISTQSKNKNKTFEKELRPRVVVYESGEQVGL